MCKRGGVGVATDHQRLACDVIVVADSDNWTVHDPSLTVSLRGLVEGTLEVATLATGLHSGMFGGAAPDALMVLCTVLARFWDGDGQVAVPGLVSARAADVDYDEALLARQAGGEWLLRIEDVDPPREIAGAADGQIATLAAFGLHHDGPIEYQSRRHALYQAELDRLLGAGHAFECHCSRSDLAASGGIHRHCIAGRRRPDPAIRLRVDDGCEVAFDDLVHGRVAQRVDIDAGDFVLRRADGLLSLIHISEPTRPY